jgi:hypothetical protein
MKKTQNKSFVVVVPVPTAMEFSYTKADKSIKYYPRVVPIEIKGDSFSAYVFGEGVRSFRFDRILSPYLLK